MTPKMVLTPRGSKTLTMRENENGRNVWTFLCENCMTTYTNSVKTDVQWHMRMHRECPASKVVSAR